MRPAEQLVTLLKSLPEASEDQKSKPKLENYGEWKRSNDPRFARDFPIKRIRFRTYRAMHTFYNGVDEVIMDIVFIVGKKTEKKVVFVNNSNKKEINRLMSELKLKTSQVHLFPGEPLNWSNLKDHYVKETVDFYHNLQKQILDQLETFLINLKGTFNGLNILDAGCGPQSDFLIKVFNTAKNHVTELRVLGVDRCLIPQLPANCPKEVTCTKEDLCNINMKTHPHLLHHPEVLTIVICKGYLNERTVKDTFECLNVLKLFWRGKADYILAGGVTPMVFYPAMLKRVGYAHCPIKDLHILRRMDAKERTQQFKTKLKDHSQLDLALAPVSQVFLQNLAEEKSAITCIDLSFSHLEKPEDLAKDFASFPDLKEVVCYTDNPSMLRYLIQSVPRQVTLILEFSRNPRRLMGSRAYSQRFFGDASLKDPLYEPYNQLLSYFRKIFLEASQDEQPHVLKCIDAIADIMLRSPDTFKPKTEIKTMLSILQTIFAAQDLDNIKNFLQRLIGVGAEIKLDLMTEMLVKANQPQALKYLFKPTKESSRDLSLICRQNPKIVFDAVEAGAVGIIQLLAEAKVDFSSLRFEDKTLMIHACKKHQLTMVSLLGQLCPELINAQSSFGSPLSMIMSRDAYDAGYEQNMVILNELLRLKPDLRALSYYTINCQEKVRALQKVGFDFDYQELNVKDGKSAFETLVQEMLSKKNDANWSNINPLAGYCLAILQILKEKKMDPHNPQFMYNGKWQPLKERLAELASGVVNQFGEDDACQIGVLFSEVAEKFNCEEALRILINNRLHPHRQPSSCVIA